VRQLGPSRPATSREVSSAEIYSKLAARVKKLEEAASFLAINLRVLISRSMRAEMWRCHFCGGKIGTKRREKLQALEGTMGPANGGVQLI